VGNRSDFDTKLLASTKQVLIFLLKKRIIDYKRELNVMMTKEDVLGVLKNDNLDLVNKKYLNPIIELEIEDSLVYV
jgi:hypothetical protein